MTVDTQKLRELQARATPGPLTLATSNSWRRIVSYLGSKPVCVPCTQPDGHPDLHFPNGGAEGPDATLLIEAWNNQPALLDEIDRLRAELQERQWQPIETAPHETLVVLGWHDENGVFKQEIALASAGTRYPGGASDMWWHGRATHWMPLDRPPAPPQGEKE